MCGAGDQMQGLVHAKYVLRHWATLPAPKLNLSHKF